jgi:hypothetical protein
MESSFATAAERGQNEENDLQGATEKAMGQAQEKAQQASEQARDRVREQLDGRSTQAGEQVSSTASDIRSVAHELRAQGKDQPAKLAEQAADRAERIGSYLKDSDADRMLHDLEEFGRSRPWAMAVGGVLAGVAASRFLKASSGERYRSSQSRPPIGNGRAQNTPQLAGVYSPPGGGV